MYKDEASFDIAADPHQDSDAGVMASFLRKPGFLLARIDQISTALFGEACGAVTLNQAEFLLLLRRFGVAPQVFLARAAGVDTSTTAYILNNLQARGWIARAASGEDRRQSLVSLTLEGESRVADVLHHFHQLQARLDAPLGAEAAGVLRAALRRIGSDPSALAPPWRAACDSAAGVLDNAPSFLARRGLQVFQAQFTNNAKPYGLTLRQFSLLFILSRRAHVTQAQFARIFGLDPSTCGVIMRGLARRGLIDAMRSADDARARIYWLTDSGRAMLEKAHPLAERSEATVLRCLDDEGRAALVRSLRTVAKTHSHVLRFPGAIASL